MNNKIEVDLEKSGLERICGAVSLAGLVGFAVLLVGYWKQLPANMPIHFNLQGEVDGWGSKNALLVLPGVALFTYVLLTIVVGFPKYINYPVQITPENAARQYRLVRHLMAVMKTVIVLGLLGLTWLIIKTALSTTPQLHSWPGFAFVGSVFAVVIGYMVIALKKKNPSATK